MGRVPSVAATALAALSPIPDGGQSPPRRSSAAIATSREAMPPRSPRLAASKVPCGASVRLSSSAVDQKRRHGGDDPPPVAGGRGADRRAARPAARPSPRTGEARRDPERHARPASRDRRCAPDRPYAPPLRRRFKFVDFERSYASPGLDAPSRDRPPDAAWAAPDQMALRMAPLPRARDRWAGSTRECGCGADEDADAIPGASHTAEERRREPRPWRAPDAA